MPTEEKKDNLLNSIRENLEAIIIAFAFALIIRCFFIEVFKIPTGSMQPTLMGDTISGRNVTGGDRIMATKYYYGLTPVERFDVIVFKFPLNVARNFIKRVVGLPGEKFQIYDGNIYFKNKSHTDYQIARKPLTVADAIMIPVWPKNKKGLKMIEHTFQSNWTSSGVEYIDKKAEYEIVGSDLIIQEKEGIKSISFEYIGSLKDDEGSSSVRNVGDLRFSFIYNPSSTDGFVFAMIEDEYASFEVQLHQKGESILIFNGKENVKIPLHGVKIKPEQDYKVDLFVFDGSCYVRVNGEVIAQYDFIKTLSDAVRRNDYIRVKFGSNNQLCIFKDISLSRDIYYKTRGGHNIKEGEPIEIPQDCYVVMGDNVNNSHDSRAWTLHEFNLKNGKKIICEGSAIATGAEKTELLERHDLEYVDHVIKEDIYGNFVYFNEEDLAEPEKISHFTFIEKKYIVGKALWIFWPSNRWFRLIK